MGVGGILSTLFFIPTKAGISKLIFITRGTLAKALARVPLVIKPKHKSVNSIIMSFYGSVVIYW